MPAFQQVMAVQPVQSAETGNAIPVARDSVPVKVGGKEGHVSLFVQVTFDLERASPSDYFQIEVRLAQLRLGRTIERQGADPIQLPNNTFAGIVNYAKDMSEVFKAIRKELETASLLDGLRGRAFISGGSDTVKYQGVDFDAGVVRVM